MSENVYDTIVIGGGPGGYTAAMYCARSGLSVLVIEKMSPGGQMTLTGQVDNYPGFDEGIDGFELGERMQKSAERFGARTAYEEVIELSARSDPKRVVTALGEYQAKTLVIATGASPRRLGLAEEDSLRGRGVAYCATCDGMQYKGKTVVVVGGGNSAAEDAIYLSKICKKVYLVHRRDSLRASMVYRKALEASPVDFRWDSRVVEILHDNRVTGVRLENLKTGGQSELSCDGVFVAVGREPDTKAFIGQVDMDERGYIVAGETTKTSAPGVFAVGDARVKPLRQIVTAAADGAVASKYIEEYLMA